MLVFSLYSYHLVSHEIMTTKSNYYIGTDYYCLSILNIPYVTGSTEAVPSVTAHHILYTEGQHVEKSLFLPSPKSTASCCHHMTLVTSLITGSHVTTRKLQFTEECRTLRAKCYELSKTFLLMSNI